MFAALFIAAAAVGQWSPDVLVHEADGGKTVFLVTEDPIYEEKTEAWSVTGCFCSMCLGNGSSGYKTKTICVNGATPMADLGEVLRHARLTPDDILIDCGCGDGRASVLASAAYEARSVGLDIRPVAVHLSQANARRSGVAGLTRFYERDCTRVNLDQATVVYAFLPPNVLERLAAKLPSLPEVRLAISYEHAWPVGEDEQFGKFHLWWLRRARQSPSVVKPTYVFRVWSSAWCAHCKDPTWLRTVDRLARAENLGVQRCDFDKYRTWCEQNGIGSVPTVQVFRGEGDDAVEINRFSGARSWNQLMATIPEEDRP